MKNSFNLVTKNNRKKILIYSNDELAKNSFFNTIYNHFKILNQKERETKEITFEIFNNKKNQIVKLTDSINIDAIKTTNIDFSYIYRKIK